MTNNTLKPLNLKLTPFQVKILSSYKPYRINNNLARTLKVQAQATRNIINMSKIQNYLDDYNIRLQQSIMRIKNSNYFKIKRDLLSSLTHLNYNTFDVNIKPVHNSVKNAPVIIPYNDNCIEENNVQNTKYLKQENTEQDYFYQLEYNKNNRYLTIEGKFVLARTNFNSKQDNILIYLSKNPNKDISLKELENAIGVEINTPLHNIVRDLGFIRKIKEIFLDVSNDSIKYKPKITKSDYNELSNSLIPIQHKVTKKNNETC